jgi:uncharacterized membrane protein YgcG
LQFSSALVFSVQEITMKLRLSLLVAALTLLFVPLTQAQTQCNATIIDQAGVIHNPQVIGNAARTLINQGADVKVVIVDSIARYGSGLADVERQFEANCPSWTTNGQRKANLFVVMVAPNDRAKNMFLGSYYNGAFDITSTYSQLSNTYFKNRQWELGLAAVLQGTTSQALTFHAAQQRGPGAAGQPRTYTASGAQNVTPTQQADSGTSGLLIFVLVLLGLTVIGVVVYLIYRAKTAETETTTDTTPSYDSTPSPDRTAYSAPAPNPYRYAAAAPSHTTVINNNSGSGDGLLTGIVVGEMLSRPNNPTVVYEQPPTTYVEPAPSYTAPAPTQDAPDSSWEAPTQSAPDTSFTPEPETPSYEAPSTDFGGGGDSGFGGGSSGGDSGF